jgi:hypothetical protein
MSISSLSGHCHESHFYLVIFVFLSNFVRFAQFFVMAACYHVDSDSDASSSDFSIPPTVDSRKKRMPFPKRQEMLPIFSLTPESQNKGDEGRSIPTDVEGSLKHFVGENESGSDIKGYTPPPPRRKRKLSLRQDFHGVGEIQRPVTHEFMSHKNDEKGNCDLNMEERQEFKSSVSMHSRKGSSSDAVSNQKERPREKKDFRERGRKQKNVENSREASPSSSDCKIVSLAETDSDSWESCRNLSRTSEEREIFRRQLGERKRQRELSEKRYQERLTSTIVGRDQTRAPQDDLNECSPRPVSVWQKGSDSHGNRTFSGNIREDVASGKRVNDQKFAKVKLEKEDILATKRKSCCKHLCLLKLGTRGIRHAREKYFRLKCQDRPLSLQWLVGEGDTQNEDQIRFGGEDFRPQNSLMCEYKIFGRGVCRHAFKLIFCIGNHTLDRLRFLKNQSVEVKKPLGRVRGSLSYILESWMQDFFHNNCEKLPNKDILHLPDSFSKLEVWKIFKSTFADFDKTEKVTYRYWCKMWTNHFPNVKIPKLNRFGVCADCEEFKTIREKAVTADEKSKKLFVYQFQFGMILSL